MSSWPPPQRPRAQISQMPYMPGLDGIRALAVVAVMVYHADHLWLSGGFLGVEVFFVISGYLITLLLIGEHERTGRVNLRQFWKRRFRRLLPALFVMMGLLALYLAIADRRPQGRTRGDFLGGIFYGSNWYQIVVGQSYTAAEAFAPLRHLWSLAVEEQFYLVWPLVMVLILRLGRDRLPKVALWLAGTSVAIAVIVGVLFVSGDVADQCGTGGVPRGYVTLFGRCININDALYLSTFSRAGGLLMGAAFAMVWRPQALLRGPMRRKGRLLDVFALVGLGVLVLLTIRLSLSGSGAALGSRYDPWLFRGGFFVTGLATLAVIAAVVHRQAFSGRILGNPVLRWAGKRSYGLYLFHWPIYQIIRKSAGLPLTTAQFVVAMAITVPVTELSYRLVETPIRTGRLSELIRGGRHRGTATYRNRRRLVLVVAGLSTLLGFAGVSIAVANNVCVGAVECSVQIGAEQGPTEPLGAPGTIATTTTAPGVAEETTTSTTMVTAPPTDSSTVATNEPVATVAPPTTIAPASAVQPVALGESVMLGAITNLQNGGFFVDALLGRQGTEMASLVESMRAADQLGQVVVIQTGTNGRISANDLDRIMAQLPPDRTPTVVFLTVRVPRSWQDGNNVLIRDLPNRYPNVKIVDWQVESMSITICSDGTHIACGPDMAKFYTNLIFAAIGRPDLIKPVGG